MSFLLCACGCGGALHPATSVVRYAPVRVTDATEEPVTLAEAKLHLRVEHTVDDALIASLITAARQHVEDYCEASFAAEETWQVTVDGAPPDVIALTRGPVQEVVTVHLVDQFLVEVEVADARLDLGSQPARLYAPGGRVAGGGDRGVLGPHAGDLRGGRRDAARARAAGHAPADRPVVRRPRRGRDRHDQHHAGARGGRAPAPLPHHHRGRGPRMSTPRPALFDAGRLDRRITLQALTWAEDEFGQVIETWTDFATVWAEVQPMAGLERVQAAQLMSIMDTRFMHPLAARSPAGHASRGVRRAHVRHRGRDRARPARGPPARRPLDREPRGGGRGARPRRGAVMAWTPRAKRRPRRLPTRDRMVVGVEEIQEVFRALPDAVQRTAVKTALEESAEVRARGDAAHRAARRDRRARGEPPDLPGAEGEDQVVHPRRRGQGRVLRGASWSTAPSHMPARPWLRPALDSVVPRASSRRSARSSARAWSASRTSSRSAADGGL